MNYQVNQSEIVTDLIDGEVILLNLTAGTYYNFDSTAATLWQWLECGASTSEMHAALVKAYPEQNAQQLSEELAGWLSELANQQLLSAASQVPGGQGPEFQGPYNRPVLIAHADMAELLKLDPVHEAGDPGWPALPAQG